jgi:Protein of unknown function (DUF3352)
MRRFVLLTALIALCLAVAGCGSGGGGKPASSLDDAVGYFARDAPFVAAIETDPNGPQIKQVKSLVGSLPAAAILGSRLQALAQLRFVDWSRDIRPQLGAPLVVGLTKPAAGADIGVATVLAMRVNHPSKVKQVLLRQPNFRGRGKSSGVRIYEDPIDERYAAVDGDVLVAATNREILEQALSMKRSDNRMRASGFERDLKGLPTGGLVRVSADPRQLIGADARLRPALNVKWLASLRRLGLVARAVPSGVTLDFHAASDRASIRDADLPLAPGAKSVPLIGTGDEVQVGLRDPGRLTRFLTTVWRAVAPKHAAQFTAREPRGIDLEQQLPHHFGGLADLALDPFTRVFAARVTLNESTDVKAALARLTPALPDLAALLGVKGLGVAAPPPGESFYALAKPNGKTAVFGVIGNALVASSDASRAAGLASEPTHKPPGGAKGAAVVTLNAREVVTRLLARRLGGAAGLFASLATASLRDLTGALTISRGGLDGHFKLAVVK